MSGNKHQFSIKFQGKEIENPFLRTFATVLALIVIAIAFLALPIIVFSIFGIFFGMLILAALLVIPHFILRAMGRQGFFHGTYENGRIEYVFSVNRDSLKKVK